MNKAFSVLMSVYRKESPAFFDVAMTSIWDEQTVKPSEIVLVKDGPLTTELDLVIDEWKRKLPNLKVVPLEKNQGLGDALRIGLDNCSNDIVARMDTDDISHPQRFEKQLEFLVQNPEVAIVGTAVTEFDDDPSIITGYRDMPKSHEDIVGYSKTRCPFNHPTVMYKKEAIISSGSYQKYLGFEDYYLWIRLIISGAKTANLKERLVNMRAGLSMLSRRGGLRYGVNEVRLFIAFYRLGFITFLELVKSVLIRFPIRIMPQALRKRVYMSLRKSA